MLAYIIRITLLLLAIGISDANARIGETEAQIVSRYGKPTEEWKTFHQRLKMNMFKKDEYIKVQKAQDAKKLDGF